MLLRKEKYNHNQFNLTDWEKYNRDELNQLYEYINLSILGNKCSYDSFIRFCFRNSSQIKPEEYVYERVYKKIKKIN